MNRPRTGRSLLIFVTFQVAFVALVGVVPWVRAKSMDRHPRLPQLNNRPVAIAAEYNEPFVITDEQLTRVLDRLAPRLTGEKPKINYVDHALRFWGAEATFADAACLSGADLRRLLTDHRAFAAAWGNKERPLLQVKDSGLAVRTQQGNSTASHVDHTLATLAEVGTPLDFVLTTNRGESTMRAMLTRALESFDINQQEYEWTVLAAALYVADGRSWYSAEGERIDFDRCARRLIRQQFAQGVCYGNHRLYTLTMLLRIDDRKQLLRAETRAAVVEHLQEATRRLVASQSTEGFWDQNWPNAQAPINDPQLESPLSRRLLATGHALEWWAMAPRELHPPREVLVRAGQWLVVEVEKMEAADIEKNYTFLTHVGRALRLWRSGTTVESES